MSGFRLLIQGQSDITDDMELAARHAFALHMGDAFLSRIGRRIYCEYELEPGEREDECVSLAVARLAAHGFAAHQVNVGRPHQKVEKKR